jgi:hypothetical protein
MYYIRPNNLVRNSRAAIVSAFNRRITINNTGLTIGDVLKVGSVILTAGTDFPIGASSIDTATNIVTAINTEGTYTATNGTPSTATLRVFFEDQSLNFTTTNSSSFIINTGLSLQFNSIPSNIANGTKVDFLETESGHKIFTFDVKLGANVIMGEIIDFQAGEIPEGFQIGDYICSQYECIIPFLPDDLHPTLVQRTCLRILGAQSDMTGQQTVQNRINEMQHNQGILIDNRAEGNTKKVLNRNSFLRYGKRSDIGKV